VKKQVLGVCPKCGSNAIMDELREFIDNEHIIFTFTCGCGVVRKETYKLIGVEKVRK
jgi:hypothetical protein